MDYMDNTRLGKINDRIKEKIIFHYISVARGKGICTIIARSEELSKIRYPRFKKLVEHIYKVDIHIFSFFFLLLFSLFCSRFGLGICTFLQGPGSY